MNMRSLSRDLTKRMLRPIALLAAWALFTVGWLAVAPTADAAAVLRVQKAQIFLLPAPVNHTLKIIDVVSVVNAGSRAADVRVSLPAGAQGVSTDGGSATVKGGEVVFPLAARPGVTSTVTVSYAIPFRDAQGVTVAVRSLYDVDQAELYLPVGQFTLSAPGLLTSTQVVDVAGTQCRVFTRLGIPAGEDWTIAVQALPTGGDNSKSTDGLPVLGAGPSDRDNLLQAAANLLVCAVVLGVGLVGIRSTQRSPFSGRHGMDEAASLRELENVEWQHETGMIDDATYARRKQRLVSQYLRSHTGKEGG